MLKSVTYRVVWSERGMQSLLDGCRDQGLSVVLGPQGELCLNRDEVALPEFGIKLAIVPQRPSNVTEEDWERFLQVVASNTSPQPVF